MIKHHNILIVLLCIVGLVSCHNSLDGIADTRFVIEAFLYAGEPVSGIRVKTSIPLSYPDSTAQAITNAQVVLIKEEQIYQLLISENDDYEYTDSDLVVEAGDVFEIQITYNGITASGMTVVPSATTGLIISEDTIIIPEIVVGGPGMGGQGGSGSGAQTGELADILNNSIIAEWDNPLEDLYFLVVENLADELDPIYPDRIADRLRRSRFVSVPTTENFIEYTLTSLETYGEHVLKVYHVNQEYAALYENLEQDSRDLNEPPSNIRNGLGIFSAFNSQNVNFYVNRE